MTAFFLRDLARRSRYPDRIRLQDDAEMAEELNPTAGLSLLLTESVSITMETSPIKQRTNRSDSWQNLLTKENIKLVTMHKDDNAMVISTKNAKLL